MSTSLFRIHGLSNYPSHFVDNEHILIESGTILSCLNTTNGHQTNVLSLTEFDSISCVASNPSNQIFVIAIQSGQTSRMELYRFDDGDTELLHLLEEEECSAMGYSHIDISHDGKYMMAISNIPDLQIEFWSLASAKPSKLASNQIQWDDIQYVSFSPTSNELFLSATKNTIVLWRIYYKFDQYFLTSTIHSVDSMDSTPMAQIKCITFGEAGTQIIYCNNFGEMMIFDENDSNHTMKHKLNASDIGNLIFTRFYYIIVFAQQGIIQFISKHNLQNVYQYPIGSAVKHCICAPNYKQLLIINRANDLLHCFIRDTLLLTDIRNAEQLAKEDAMRIDKICTFTQITPNQGLNIVSLQTNDGILLQSGDTQTLQMIQFDDDAIEISEIPIHNVSTIEIFHYKHETDLIALGFNTGQFGLCYASATANTKLKLFFVQRLFENNVKQIEFDSNGHLIACISSSDTKIWFIQLIANAAPIILGYYQLNSIPICCCFIHDAYDTLKIIIAFDNGFVATYDAPTYAPNDNRNHAPLSLESFYVDCEVDFTLQKITRDPNQTAPDRLLCLTEDHKLRAFLLDDDATVFPDDTFIFDDHMKRMTDIRVNAEYDLLFTTSTDGTIIIRSLSDPTDILESIYAHNAPRDGVLCAAFVQSASKLLSIGYDGSVISWQLEVDSLDIDHGLDYEDGSDGNGVECPLSIEYVNETEPVTMNDEDECIQFEEMRKREIMDKEKERFEPRLREIEGELSELRQEYVTVVDAVAAASDLEKLEDAELIVDSAQYEALVNENKKEIEERTESIKYENIGKQLITRRIREQCWDQMAQKLQIVNGIKSGNNAVTVSTFPILSHSKNALQLQKKLQFLRKMNIMEQKWSNKTQDRVRMEFDAKQAVNDPTIQYIWDINEENDEMKDASATRDKNGDESKQKDNNNNNGDTKEEDGGSRRVKFAVSKPLTHLLFHSMELYTNYRKRIQIHLLNLRIGETKSKFNREVEKLFKLKKNEIERMNEMSLEIRDIEKELGIENGVIMVCTLDENEDKERIFAVNDDEIEVEKVLRMHDNNNTDDTKAADAKDSDDDATQRALQEMMNNTLESKDEVERLQDTLKKPEFMDKLEESKYNEAQKAQVAKYLAKKEALIKAKEVRQKLLRTRLKSLKNDVADICKTFDHKLSALYDIELSVMEDIYVHELMLIHLTNDIVEYEAHRKRIRNMNVELIRLKQDKEKADHTYNQFNHKLQESKKQLSELQAADKYLEKAFKKEMQSNNNDYFDYLFKLFRGKKAILPTDNNNNNNSSSDLLSKRGSTKSIIKRNVIETANDNNINDTIMEEGEAEDDEEKKYNPYFERKQMESGCTKAMNLLCPPDLSGAIWNRFLELRQLKVNKDGEVSNLVEQIASMEAEVNALQSNQCIILESMEEIERGRELIISRRNEYKLDCELFFCTKQGAVEVDESPVVTDMRQSVMCQRAVIENLNKIIVSAGSQHIERLNEMKKFRRGINALNWRAKLLDLEHRYYTLLTTEYQLRRVTKKDQEIIKAGGHSNKEKNEVVSLERKLEFTKNIMEQKIKETKNMYKKYKMRMEDITKANHDLVKEIQRLHKDVTSKQEIINIRASQGGVTHEKKQMTQNKMDAVVTRRKLVDLVKAQSDEIDFLRNELDRLRRSTFPSFSIHQSN